MCAGKTFKTARSDVAGSIDTIRYYAGWADKISGRVLEVRSAISRLLLARSITRSRPMNTL
jgi:acyl-CoA reductase-like NAD-dependent aldehyde dehydrogenase